MSIRTGLSSLESVCCSLVFFLFLLLPFPAPAAPGPDTYTIDGYLSTRYTFRNTRSDTLSRDDQDIFGELRLDLTMPVSKRYELHLLGTGRQDIDGGREPRTFSPLEDAGDTGNHSAKAYVHEAHLDVNHIGPVTQVRLGRQAGTRDEAVFFDGIGLDIETGEALNLTVYGGAAVHFHELFREIGDDTVAGAGLDLRALRSTTLSIDYLGADDERTYPSVTDVRDNMLSLKLWHRFSPGMRATAKYRYLNGDPRDFSLRAIALFSSTDIEVNANYFRQFAVQNELANEFSLYYDIIGRTNPYESCDVTLRKLFGKHYALDLGYSSRDLIEKQYESEFNRRFSRGYAIVEVMDVLMSGLSLSVTGEAWRSAEQAFRTWGGDLSYAFPIGAKKATLGAGTYFSLYKYDYYAERGERTKTRTSFVNTRYPLRSGLWLNAAYEYEQAIEDYQTLKLAMRYDF